MRNFKSWLQLGHISAKADNLSKREVCVYTLIKNISFVYLLCFFVWYFVIRINEPEQLNILFALIGSIPAIVFGFALKTDTRIIYGIRWLREDLKD